MHMEFIKSLEFLKRLEHHKQQLNDKCNSPAQQPNAYGAPEP